GSTFGKSGRSFRAPERFVKSEGIQTRVMKFRLVQSLPGRSLTRLDLFGPADEVWRTILRFLEKGFGTRPNHISHARANQTAQMSATQTQAQARKPPQLRHGRHQTCKHAIPALRIRTRIPLFVQFLKPGEKRIVSEKSVGKIALDEFAMRRSRREIVNEHGTRFSGAQKINREFEGAKILWPINQDG